LKFKGDTIEEHKAEVLIKLRKYRLIKKEKHEGAIGYIVNIPKDKEKALVWCILGQATVGIALMNALYKLLEEKGLERTIVITEGRFTHAAKQGAKKRKVELLPKSFPVFEIFDHKLVPKHEILSEKEKSQILAQYKIQPYKMPQVKSTDPAVKAIGAKPGDMLKIIRKSATAGEHIAYRYVVD
jgi:DNA-directed RNA polymerase subunit H